MYKVYDYQNQQYLRQQGEDHPAEFPDKVAAENFLYDYKDGDRERLEVFSTIDARNQGIPLNNAFSIHEDTMHKDLKSAFETYYDAKIEVSFNSPEGHVTVLHHEDTDRYGVAYLNLDTQEVSSKGGFEEKEHAMEFADDIKNFGMDMDKVEVTREEMMEEKTLEIEFDR